MDPDTRALGAGHGNFPQLRRIHPGHIEETGAKLLHIGAAEGAVARQLDVVGNDHHITGTVAGIHGTGGVSNDRLLNTQQLEYPDGNNQLLKIIALIGVEAAGHTNDLAAADSAEDQLARVGSYCGHKEIGNVLIIHHDGVFDLLRERPETGAENNGDLRCEIHLFLEIIYAFLKIVICIGHTSDTSCFFSGAAQKSAVFILY